MVYRYVGNGRFYNNIPARDLTHDDIAILSDDQRALVSDGVLYKKVRRGKETSSQNGTQNEKQA